MIVIREQFSEPFVGASLSGSLSPASLISYHSVPYFVLLAFERDAGMVVCHSCFESFVPDT